MTVNIAIKTNGALVLGCDSIASSTQFMLDPARLNERIVPTDDGRFHLDFDGTDLTNIVLDTRGGVLKMFELWGAPSVAAVTTGVGSLNEKSISNLAMEFHESFPSPRKCKVVDVAQGFLEYVRAEYERDQAQKFNDEQYWSELLFLVGGYNKDDALPVLFRLDVKTNSLEQQLEGQPGIAWAGQTNAVERFVMGIDQSVIGNVASQLNVNLEAFHNTVLERVLAHLALDERFEGYEFDIEYEPDDFPAIEWYSGASIPQTSYLSEQSAIDLAALLVNIQSGYARYVPGVATVGGRTRIGVITRGEPFRMINEPELKHEYVGFSD